MSVTIKDIAKRVGGGPIHRFQGGKRERIDF